MAGDMGLRPVFIIQSGNLRGRLQPHPKLMPTPRNVMLVLALVGAHAAGQASNSGPAAVRHGARASQRPPAQMLPVLNQDERLAVIAAALDSRTQNGESDCSHMVQEIYEHAGFPYDYATSLELYAGIRGFQRISQPQVGDLVVWKGHVGIVVRPSHHVFFSFLSSGPGIENYASPYWRNRGPARFYRYIKRG